MSSPSLDWCLFLGRPRAQWSFITLHASQKNKALPSLWLWDEIKRGKNILWCCMHYSQKLASSDFSKAQIVVNDSKLPRGFEISTVWGSFSCSKISNGFISEGPVTMQTPLWANGWLISILNEIIANLFSWRRERRVDGDKEETDRRRWNGKLVRARRREEEWCRHSVSLSRRNVR